MADTVASAATALSDLGSQVEQVGIPWLAERDCTRISGTLFTAEVLPFLRGITAGREAALHPVIARTLQSPDVTIADYLAAESEVEHLRSVFAQAFQAYDVLVCPVVTIPAPPHARSS